LIALAAFFIMLLIRGDGHFPIPKTVDPGLFRVIVLSQTAVLVVLTLYLLKKVFFKNYKPMREIVPRTVFMIIGISILCITVLHFIQASYFARFGYRNDYSILMASIALSILLLAVLWEKNRFWAILSSAIALKLYPILAFPITAHRSDMIPILVQAAGSLLNGDNVYRCYLLDNDSWTQTVRFPGIITAYIPSVILKFDPRLILLACEILFFKMAQIKYGKDPWFIPGLTLLAFSPYWHYRHELYEIPFWVILFAVIMNCDKKRYLIHPIAFAVLISFHQWGVLFFPFIMIYLGRRTSWGYASLVAVVSSFLSVLIVAFFCKFDFSAFLLHTFKYYDGVLKSGSLSPGSLYFTPETVRIMGYNMTRLLILAGEMLILTAAFFMLDSMRKLLGFLSAALFFMLLFNAVTWTYQYLLLGALLWLSLMTSDEPVGHRVI
jgi:hypothetical protein